MLKNNFKFIIIMVMAIAYTMTANAQKDVYFATRRSIVDEYDQLLGEIYDSIRIEIDWDVKEVSIDSKSECLGTGFNFSNFRQSKSKRAIFFFNENGDEIGGILFTDTCKTDFEKFVINDECDRQKIYWKGYQELSIDENYVFTYEQYTMTDNTKKDVYFASVRHRPNEPSCSDFKSIGDYFKSIAYPMRIEVNWNAKTLLVKTKKYGVTIYTFSDFSVKEDIDLDGDKTKLVVFFGTKNDDIWMMFKNSFFDYLVINHVSYRHSFFF